MQQLEFPMQLDELRGIAALPSDYNVNDSVAERKRALRKALCEYQLRNNLIAKAKADKMAKPKAPPVAKPIVKEPPTRMKVLDALYKGTRNRPAITTETGLSPNSTASALRVLVELGLVYKITPKRGNLYSYRISEAGRRVVNAVE